MPESLFGRVPVTPEFREGMQLYMLTQGLYLKPYAETVGLDRATLRRVLTGKVRTVVPQVIGRIVRGLGLSRREEAYMYGLVGWQLPLFDDKSPVWDPKIGSIGANIDEIVVDVGLTGPQRRIFADILVPNALALARLIKLGLSPQGQPLQV